MFKLCCSLLLIACSSVLVAEEKKDLNTLTLGQNDSVVFLGSELVEQDIKYNYLETALTLANPNINFTFRNMGWAGDDPTGRARGYFGGPQEGYQRLQEELKRLKPTVIIIYYGTIGQRMTDSEKLQTMKDYERLLMDLKKLTPRIYVIADIPRELPANNQATNLEIHDYYKTFINPLLEKLSIPRIDIYNELHKQLADNKGPRLTSDSLRYQDEGYRLIASNLLTKFNVKQPDNWDSYAELRQLIKEKNDLYFHRYRPQNETYLRGFRKHEQGQNAVEIEQFDKLIAQAEARIRAQVKGEPLPQTVDEPPVREQSFVANPPAEQAKQFSLAAGLKVELFAAEPMVKNPIAMNFDSKGRLWVACSPIYPQLRPGAKPTDKVVILEDTDGDGLADKTTDFAEDLLIPTGVLPDEKGGAYVGNSTELLHLEDTNGDGKADKRTVLLSGFGTEDTHHILHTFTWGPDGNIYFNQSIYIHTYAETMHGVKKLLAGGTWRYNPATHHLEVFSKGLINHWGHVFDRFGQSFMTDGAGGEGINYSFPGAAFPTASDSPRIIHGLNPGQPKLCSLEILSGTHFSDKWQNRFISADFRSNRIVSFEITPSGSAYISRQTEDIITCRDRAFRPVDIKMGYDGCLYIADWHNPIINHGEVDFRDPRRDDRHGRIWRIMEDGRQKAVKPDFAAKSTSELVEMLNDPLQLTGRTSRVLLDQQDPKKVRTEMDTALTTTLFKLGETNSPEIAMNNQKFWRYADYVITDELKQGKLKFDFSIELKEDSMFFSSLKNMDHRMVAFIIRIIRNRVYESQQVVDYKPIQVSPTQLVSYIKAFPVKSPQIWLETLHLLRILKDPAVVDQALEVLAIQPLDDFLDYSLWLTIRETQSQWLPELNSGKLTFINDASKLMYVIKATENPVLIDLLAKMLEQKKVPVEHFQAALELIGKYGQPQHLQQLWDLALADPNQRTALVRILYETNKARKIQPNSHREKIADMADIPYAFPLAGLWKVNSVKPMVTKLALDNNTPEAKRIQTLLGLEAYNDKETLVVIATGKNTPIGFKRLAINSVLNLDTKGGVNLAAGFISELKPDQKTEFLSMLDAVLAKQQGPNLLAEAIASRKLNPDLAAEAIRKASSIGNRGEKLIASIRKVSEVKQGITKLTPEQMQTLINKVSASGNPERGETIYRRKDLNCQKCHQLAGAGGLVGPDMLSLGASSPVDYIIQSLIEPSAKIKEGYHTTQVQTDDGKALNGLLIRETNDEVVLRDAENREVIIRKETILDKKNSTTSMMPAELTAKLSEDEFVDLVAFLSNLGKEGPYKAPAKRFVRRWILDDKSEVYSKIDGTLPTAEVQEQNVTIEIKVTAPGKVGLKLSDTQLKRVTRGNQEDNLKADNIVVDLPVGVHQFHFGIPKRTNPFHIEVIDIPNSSGVAEPLNK